MPYALVRHKVEDYEKWKLVFGEDAPNREASGSKGGYLFRNADDPNELRCRKETAQRQIDDPKFYVLVSKSAEEMLKRNRRHG